MPRNLIPLSELPTSEVAEEMDTVPPVVWNVELPPHVDTDRVALDIGHMRRLQKLGAISTSLFYSYQGDVTQYEPTIVGMNSDGTALAGAKASKTKTVQKSIEKNFDDVPPGADPYNYFKVITTHGLNRAELARKVSDGVSRHDWSDEKVWADELDVAAQQSLRESARDTLIGPRPFFRRALDSIVMGSLGTAIVADILANNPDQILHTSGFVAANRALLVLLDSAGNKIKTGDSYLRERRWSLFEDMQPDRYLALNGLTRINSLIRYRR